MKIILASQSPRRFELLKTLGITVTPIAPKVTEISVDKSDTPWEIALENAQMKADYIFSTYGILGGDLIIGGDTIVTIDGEILGKPKSLDENKSMLYKLSGKAHKVLTAYKIINKDGQNKIDYVTSEVLFRELEDKEIDFYINTGDGKDKAGGYALQGLGSALIKEVRGSITNVIGLPIEEFLRDAKLLLK